MKKLAMLLGILLFAGMSFAADGGIPQYQANIFVFGCCQHRMADELLYTASNNYYIYSEADGCVNPDLVSYQDAVTAAWYGGDGRTGVLDAFSNMADVCGSSPSSAECFSAAQAFFSALRSEKQAVGSAVSAYGAAARQAVLANNQHDCGTTRAQVMDGYFSAISNYKACVVAGCPSPPEPPPFCHPPRICPPRKICKFPMICPIDPPLPRCPPYCIIE